MVKPLNNGKCVVWMQTNLGRYHDLIQKMKLIDGFRGANFRKNNVLQNSLLTKIDGVLKYNYYLEFQELIRCVTKGIRVIGLLSNVLWCITGSDFSESENMRQTLKMDTVESTDFTQEFTQEDTVESTDFYSQKFVSY